jgi:hypothetical protein
MANLGEFSSLLQLGVGFGIGLSFFRAPMTLLLDRLNEDLRAEMNVFDRLQTPKANSAKGDLASLQLDIAENAEKLNSLSLPFMIAALFGAAVNWGALIYAALYAQQVLTSTEELLLIGISVVWFLAIGIAVAGAALYFLLPIRRRLSAIRSQV